MNRLLPRDNRFTQRIGSRPQAAPASRRREILVALIFLASHAVLGLLMSRFSALATLHAFATTAAGLYWALRDQTIDRALYTSAYITGAEVLWRMSGALFFWEGGKYSVCAIFIILLVRARRFKLEFLPLSYFAFLLPSAILTFSE